MRKGEPDVRCVGGYTVAGLELRLLERGESLRTELFRHAYALHGRASGGERLCERRVAPD